MPSEEWIPMADDSLVSQADIDKLLSETAPAAAPPPDDRRAATPPAVGQPPLDPTSPRATSTSC